MFPNFLTLGPLQLKSYGLLVALGVLAGLWNLKREMKRLGMETETAEGLAFTTVIVGFLGGRALYALTHPVSLGEFFRIWEGGLSFLGGLAAAAAGIVIYARKKHLSLPAALEALALSLPLGHAIGRLGCLAAGCCWGLPAESSLGITFTNPACFVPAELLGVKLHPTQIYEAAGLGLIFICLQWAKTRWPGRMLGLYLALYAILRSGLEFIRGDTLHYAWLAPLSLFQSALLCIALPAGLLWMARAPSLPHGK